MEGLVCHSPVPALAGPHAPVATVAPLPVGGQLTIFHVPDWFASKWNP